MRRNFGRLVLSAVLLAAPPVPGTPPVPPIDQPGGLGRCLPPATSVHTALPWAQQRLAPSRVWPLTTGEGQVVAVIDSGVDASVPQLAGRVLAGTDVLRGKGSASDDCLGHGTFVAGIIAAQPVAGVGFAGIAPGATVLPIRQTTDGRDGTASGLATAVRVAVDAGSKIINISSAAFYDSEQLRVAVEYAAAKDVVIVAAAANHAERGNPVAYPAGYPSVIAVGAVSPDGRRGGFSETGPYIAVAAPGVDVLSIGPRGPGHFVGSGTSYAAPFVTAVAALVRARHPKLTAAQVKHRLQATADHPAGSLPDPEVGWGVVNPYAAIATMLPEEQRPPGAAAPPVKMPGPNWPGPPDPGAVAGLATAALALLLAGAAAAIAVIIPAARRRGTRPEENS